MQYEKRYFHDTFSIINLYVVFYSNQGPLEAMLNIATSRQRSRGKVTFSGVSVHHSLQGEEGSTCDHYPWSFGTHCTGPQPCPPPDKGHGTPQAPDPAPSPEPAPASDIWWSSLETCLNLLIWTSLYRPPKSTDVWWLPKHAQLASGRYQSYRNSLLLVLICIWYRVNLMLWICSGEAISP